MPLRLSRAGLAHVSYYSRAGECVLEDPLSRASAIDSAHKTTYPLFPGYLTRDYCAVLILVAWICASVQRDAYLVQDLHSAPSRTLLKINMRGLRRNTVTHTYTQTRAQVASIFPPPPDFSPVATCLLSRYRPSMFRTTDNL